MGNRKSSRRTTLRIASTVSSMLLFAAAAGDAFGQSLATPGASPSGGAGLTIGPDGITGSVDPGLGGGASLAAGPQGLDLKLGPSTPLATEPGAGPEERVSSPGGQAAPAPPAGSRPSAPAGGGDAPDRSEPARDGGVSGREPASEARPAAQTGAPRSGLESATAAVQDLRPAARTEKGKPGGVAPVFDLVERIPSAVRAGLVALALIAIAMWALWVRGRRRLEHNAYVDPVTGVANMAAFEELLEREWQRATRYRRPLGVLLLEIELRGSAGAALLGEREARGVVGDLNEEVRESDIVARLALTRFAVICPEAPQGSLETLAHAIEHRLEERRLRCWTGFAEREEPDGRPADIVVRAAARLAEAQGEITAETAPEAQAGPLPALVPAGRDQAA